MDWDWNAAALGVLAGSVVFARDLTRYDVRRGVHRAIDSLPQSLTPKLSEAEVADAVERARRSPLAFLRAASLDFGTRKSYATIDNKDVVMAAVSRNGEALYYASGRLRDDSDVVLAAVTETGDALRFASSALRDNYDIVLAAVENNGSSIRYASKNLQDDQTIADAATPDT